MLRVLNSVVVLLYSYHFEDYIYSTPLVKKNVNTPSVLLKRVTIESY